MKYYIQKETTHYELILLQSNDKEFDSEAFLIQRRTSLIVHQHKMMPLLKLHMQQVLKILIIKVIMKTVQYSSLTLKRVS